MQTSTSAGLLPRASSLRIFKNETFPFRASWGSASHRTQHPVLCGEVTSFQIYTASVQQALAHQTLPAPARRNTLLQGPSNSQIGRGHFNHVSSNDRSAYTHSHGGHRAHLLQCQHLFASTVFWAKSGPLMVNCWQLFEQIIFGWKRWDTSMLRTLVYLRIWHWSSKRLQDQTCFMHFQGKNKKQKIETPLLHIYILYI